jgi:hypothetical protein
VGRVFSEKFVEVVILLRGLFFVLRITQSGNIPEQKLSLVN